MLHIALYEPKIPQNCGNIIRLAANGGFTLHLIGEIAFKFDDKNLMRAGLDYHDIAEMKVHASYQDFLDTIKPARVFALTTKGKNFYHEVTYQAGDVLLFGSETAGLPDEVREAVGQAHLLRIPMLPNNRSMNLANTVALVSFEAWRQLGFKNGI